MVRSLTDSQGLEQCPAHSRYSKYLLIGMSRQARQQGGKLEGEGKRQTEDGMD